MGTSDTFHYRIGIDVGGTNTDAVILDTSIKDPIRSVIATHKAPTTADVTSGIEQAVAQVLAASKINRSLVSCVAVGTTHFINAVAERDARKLDRVAILRLSKSFTREIPPFVDFPSELRGIVEGFFDYADGGLRIDGVPEALVDEAAVGAFCDRVSANKIKAIAIVGIFSPLRTNQEYRVYDLIHRRLPHVAVVCSSDIANLGLLERENASILNAAVYHFAKHTIRRCQYANLKLGLACPLYLTQNDGTMVEASSAQPIRTFASGATNSIRGAAYLSGIGQLPTASEHSKAPVIVCDIGGTTSDVCILLPSGYPRQGVIGSRVGGVKVNYAIPHVISLPLGGGSMVRKQGDGTVTVGRDSVGYSIREKAFIFGGDSLTAMDVAIAAGAPNIRGGDVSRLQQIPQSTIFQAQQAMRKSLEAVVESVKTSPGDLQMLIVGGGSLLAPAELSGVSQIIRPDFHDVANAIGAATAKISVTLDTIETASAEGVAACLQKVKQLSLEKLRSKGVLPGTEEIVEVLTLPLQYVANTVRVVVKAVGDFVPSSISAPNGDDAPAGLESMYDEMQAKASRKFTCPYVPEAARGRIGDYRPQIHLNPQTQTQEWLVSELDLEWLADGCYVLGCGGGGSPYPELLKLKDHLNKGHRIRIIDPDDLADKVNVIWAANVGSPPVVAERLSANETSHAIREILRHQGLESFDAIMAGEVGGSNGMVALTQGSSRAFDRPVVDADWIGRAFPYLWQTTLSVHAPSALLPCSIASGDGCALVLTQCATNDQLDGAIRALCVEMGYFAGFAAKPVPGELVQRLGVKRTLSQAWRIGRCIATAQENMTTDTVVEQIVMELGGDQVARILFRGKIVAIDSRLRGRHSFGEVVIEHVGTEAMSSKSTYPLAVGGKIRIPFQNENLLVEHEKPLSSSLELLASVPDLISVLDTLTGKALGIGEYQYCLHVTVLGAACSPLWSGSEAGLQATSPQAFGLEGVKYTPLGSYRECQSVIGSSRQSHDSNLHDTMQ
ncbi:hypothetical protein M409DRAFT_37650 [Zasmidium cellare ATCC 36951]|uniref:Hydantoinase/oxoprolinase N-terminal domain-containing protein n=1 Tax=Zasmidium cellare ATCC 36951 TaxID=1080233 RepID=A0A6A6C3Z1_ZASCE|nr:uncharacterized protein M409DRAFT_37650 [Zasmidium cellare ATCC 36951]KAF2160900.1 hypothetical protein M409DRAFT_37650 [Zasmidium cellare ATCC 36951]